MKESRKNSGNGEQIVVKHSGNTIQTFIKHSGFFWNSGSCDAVASCAAVASVSKRSGEGWKKVVKTVVMENR